MTREQAKALIPFMQAFVEGKEIEYRMRDGRWMSNSGHSFTPGWEYRIKPEPRGWWLNVYETGTPTAHPSKDLAERFKHTPGAETIHVREVL